MKFNIQLEQNKLQHLSDDEGKGYIEGRFTVEELSLLISHPWTPYRFKHVLAKEKGKLEVNP